MIGDIHGMYCALLQVLERAGFDPELDELISVGDLVDRGPEVREVLEFLEALSHFRWARGNHDAWALSWIRGDRPDPDWVRNGGLTTMAALEEGGLSGFYARASAEVEERWRPFFERAKDYIELDDCLFVHAGLDPRFPIAAQDEEAWTWDRSFAYACLRDFQEGRADAEPVTPYRRVFIGHTACGTPEERRPIFVRGVWLIDQGAGHGNRLTVVDVATDEWWQSERTRDLYPDHPFPRR